MLRFKASLRVFSEYFTLTELSDVFGQFSTGSFSKGEHWRKDKHHSYSLWVLKSGVFEADLNKVIETLLNKFESLEKLESDFIEKCNIDIFCMASSDNGQGELYIPISLMQRLIKNHIPIRFDVYSGAD